MFYTVFTFFKNKNREKDEQRRLEQELQVIKFKKSAPSESRNIKEPLKRGKKRIYWILVIFFINIIHSLCARIF
jgi:hypothetical protein